MRLAACALVACISPSSGYRVGKTGAFGIFADLNPLFSMRVAVKIDPSDAASNINASEGQYIDGTLSLPRAAYAESPHLFLQCSAFQSEERSGAVQSSDNPIGLA